MNLVKIPLGSGGKGEQIPEKIERIYIEVKNLTEDIRGVLVLLGIPSSFRK